jgi:hypothetical protein
MAKFYTTKPVLAFWDDQHVAPPEGAVPMTDEEHAALFAGQKSGKTIALNTAGVPVLTTPPVSTYTPETLSKAQLVAQLAMLQTRINALPED